MVHILPGRPVGKPDQMSPIRAALPRLRTTRLVEATPSLVTTALNLPALPGTWCTIEVRSGIVQQEQLVLFQPTKRATRSVAGGQELHRDESGSAAVIVDDRC